MQDKLTKLARGRNCMVRLPCCNGDRETVVLAHIRLIGISGLGLKAPSILGAYACSSCHAYADTHHDPETQLAFLEGVMRTQALLVKEKVLRW